MKEIDGPTDFLDDLVVLVFYLNERDGLERLLSFLNDVSLAKPRTERHTVDMGIVFFRTLFTPSFLYLLLYHFVGSLGAFVRRHKHLFDLLHMQAWLIHTRASTVRAKDSCCY